MPPAPPPLPPGRVLELPNRGRTFVREAEGPPGAPTLLLLHGWTASADLNWFRCYRPLAQHFRLVAIDHRGHGRGIRSIRPFRLEDCADDAAAAVEALGHDQVIPVGYSMGGPIAQLFWRRHRELTQGLVLCATSRNFGRSAQERAMFTSMLGLSGVARITPGAVRRRVADRVFERRIVEGPMADWVAYEIKRHDPAAVLQAGWAIGRFSSAEWIGQVDVPTSVVLTTHDNVVPPQRQAKLAAAIPGAEVFPVAGDHGVVAFAPERFVPALIAAARSVVSRAAVTA